VAGSAAGLLNGVPKYVASRTLAEPLAWQRSTLVTGDLAETIATVKENHDEVHVIGSLDLVQSGTAEPEASRREATHSWRLEWYGTSGGPVP
jgi:dihydrofolate reductase